MIDVDAVGADRAARRLREIGKRLPRELDTAVRQTGLAGQRQAKLNSSSRPGPRVRRGAHRRGITVTKLRRPTPTTRQIAVTPTMPYSRGLELGKKGTEQVKAHTRRPSVRRGNESKNAFAARRSTFQRGQMYQELFGGAGSSRTIQVRAHTRKVDQKPLPYLGPAARFVARVVAPRQLQDAVRRAVK